MALSLSASVCLIIRIFCHYVTENNISCDSNTEFCCKFSDSHVILSHHPASQAEVFRRRVRSSVQNLTVRAVQVHCCRSVCNLVPSRELHRPAASSERTHLPSARVSPLWTLHTATPAASKTLYWIPKQKVYFIEHIYNSTQWDLVTSWKWSFLNMVMLTWFSSPIFAWNFLTPSLVTPDGGKHANHHHKITVFYKCNVKTVLYCLQYLKKGWKNLSFPYRNL